MPPSIPPEVADRLRALAESWAANQSSERQLFQPWLAHFCEALGVDPPGAPPTDDDCFERPVRVIDGEARETTNFVDYWKAGYVAVEAKASGVATSNDLLLRKAFNQLKRYVAFIGSRPPYLIVVDVPGTLVIWDGWRGEYGDFAAGKRIALATLHQRPDDIALLRDVFSNPAARDPRGKAQAVTREIAAKLATLSATFERRGLDAERVARFLMRCVFCFFAEDVELLPKELFKRTLETARASGDPARVAAVLTNLWTTMDQGGMFGAELLHRFNGHFFNTVEALPLEPADVSLLIEAAQFDWSQVEPSIFGTLLVRALDPVERHRLGAEYTPREYIERLVEPTLVEPIRQRWTAVTAAVVQLEESGKKRDRDKALTQLREFHGWLRGLQFLDPACGSGNFLYVTMAAVKRVELEVIHEIERVGGREDKHRKDAIARDERVTMTGMYNVVEKLRSGAALSPKERSIHEIAACGVLRDMHDELDALVAEAYGWPWPMEKEEILERLVKLHDERVEEEKRGLIRWLRPEYQIPRFAPRDVVERLDLPEAAAAPAAEALRPWPKTAVEQLAAIGALLSTRPLTAAEGVAAFDGAKRVLVARHMETLAMMGEITVDAEGRYGVGRKAA